jgi:hypothetical protein
MDEICLVRVHASVDKKIGSPTFAMVFKIY